MRQISAGFVLRVLVCAFVPAFCCRAADAAAKLAAQATNNTLTGTWDITYTAVAPPPPGTNNLPTPDAITLTFSKGMTNPTNGAVFGSVDGNDLGTPIVSAGWFIMSGDTAINVGYTTTHVPPYGVEVSFAVTIDNGITTGTYSANNGGLDGSQGTVVGTKAGGKAARRTMKLFQD